MKGFSTLQLKKRQKLERQKRVTREKATRERVSGVKLKVPAQSLAFKANRSSGIDRSFSHASNTSLDETFEHNTYRWQDEDFWFINACEWCSILTNGIVELDTNNFKWESLQPVLAPAENPSAERRKQRIHFHNFINQYQTRTRDLEEISSTRSLRSMYKNFTFFREIFQWMDTDGDGTITKAEWIRGCEVLNAELDSADRIEDAEQLFSVFDFDKTGKVCMNAFFEGTRLAYKETHEKHWDALQLDSETLAQLDKRNVELRCMGWTKVKSEDFLSGKRWTAL